MEKRGHGKGQADLLGTGVPSYSACACPKRGTGTSWPGGISRITLLTRSQSPFWDRPLWLNLPGFHLLRRRDDQHPFAVDFSGAQPVQGGAVMKTVRQLTIRGDE